MAPNASISPINGHLGSGSYTCAHCDSGLLIDDADKSRDDACTHEVDEKRSDQRQHKEAFTQGPF
jgi:hypothetical protein